MKIRGIIPPIVTPFTTEQEIDLSVMRRHIEYLLSRGVHGIFVLGTTGEFYALSESEKQAVVEAAVECVEKRVPVFAGTGAETTHEVLRLTRMAEQTGASGVTVITPYFIKPSQSELADHFRRVAESTSLPVVLYSNPSTCGGLGIEPETVARLAELPNINAIKDSSGDLQNTIELIRCTPSSSFSILNGRDTLIHSALHAGADGAVPSSCNIAPELCVGIYEAFIRGEIARSRELQSRLHPIRMAMALGTGNSAVKEAMALLGRSAGPSRWPVQPFTEEKRARLRTILTHAGLI